MRQYTLHELTRLYKIRLQGFDEKESLDDLYTNSYSEFDSNVKLFLGWIKKMEMLNRIDFLLTGKES